MVRVTPGHPRPVKKLTKTGTPGGPTAGTADYGRTGVNVVARVLAPDGVGAVLLLEAVVKDRAKVERLTKPLLNVVPNPCCLFGSPNYDAEDR